MISTNLHRADPAYLSPSMERLRFWRFPVSPILMLCFHVDPFRDGLQFHLFLRLSTPMGNAGSMALTLDLNAPSDLHLNYLRC